MNATAKARCRICGKEFTFIQITKPRRYCSGACWHHGIRRLEIARRARYRAAKRNTGQGHTLQTTNGIGTVSG